MTSNTRRVAAAGAAAIAAAALLSGLGSATAEEGGVQNMQAVLRPDPATATAETMSSFWKLPGFGRTTITEARDGVNLSWKGRVPAEVLTDAAEETATRVPVTITSVPYSESDLTSAGRTLMELKNDLVGPGAIAYVAPKPDLSGLIVHVVQGSSAARNVLATQAFYESATKVPTEIVVDQGAPVLTSRQGDPHR